MSTTTMPSYRENLSELRKQLESMLPGDKLRVFDNDADSLNRKYSAAVRVTNGDKAPQFTLPNASGKEVSLKELLQQGPTIVTFYRGVWCPYCNLQLKLYQQILPQIRHAGAQLVAISPMLPDNSAQMINTNELEFEVLSDIGNQVAKKYTTVITNPQSSIEAMSELGYDFYSFYGDQSAQLPIPATFIINTEGFVTFAQSLGGDYRKRTEPEALLNVIER